jgi:cytochrome c
MNSFEMNKILGAILGTCLILVTLNITAGAVFTPRKPAKPGYEITVPEKPAAGEPKGGPAQPEQPIAALLGSADVERGKTSAQKCSACHTFDKGGKNMVGPNLWGVVGRQKASEAGFNYSAAFKALKGNWTIDDINQFITNPKAAVPGTNMTFAGVPRATERADLLVYLNSLADNPAPLPKAAEAAEAPKAQ